MNSGTYTANAFRAFCPVDGVQYFVSDKEYWEYIASNNDSGAK